MTENHAITVLTAIPETAAALVIILFAVWAEKPAASTVLTALQDIAAVPTIIVSRLR